jgi:hypothetical protein
MFDLCYLLLMNLNSTDMFPEKKAFISPKLVCIQDLPQIVRFIVLITLILFSFPSK